jgi:uncharacterized membrane protein
MFFNYFRNGIELKGVIMRKVYLYLLIGIIAIVLMTVIVFNYDPKTETWSGLLLGALFGFLFYRTIKSRRQKNVK